MLDHKSDLVEDPKVSASNYFPQLSAYFEGLTSVDPNVGSVDVAINWLSLGAVTLIDRNAFCLADSKPI